MELGRELCGGNEMTDEGPIEGNHQDIDRYGSDAVEDGHEHSSDAVIEANLSDE